MVAHQEWWAGMNDALNDMCKDSNNVDSEIHYFKDGSIPLFCLLPLCYSGEETSYFL